ncbi:MAG TPA: NAD-dependent epimerase/dehydratase family protein [Solirubrobacterales bacterium]|jgi:dihydroflavonol-4-reductase|nr:NAD-dependent epimerase/dehydratase family protein [Solirubrobacterales bacterium]
MATTLVTGGTGFIGSHLVNELARRGDELRVLVRPGRDPGLLAGIGCELAEGDVCDRDSVRAAMAGIERVFHVAGKTSMRRSDRERVFDVNVGGTRNVMEEALRAGVVRVVHTSTAGALGPAQPHGTADESQLFRAAHLGIAYINSKHEAESVAMSVAAKGLPVVIVNPTFVLGPEDPDPSGTSNGLVRRLLLRRIPAYLDGGLNIVDVRDVARGHLLAEERGDEGERYLLAGRNFSLRRLFADLSRIAGVPPPPLQVPGPVMLAVVEALEQAGLPSPTSSDEVRSGMQWWTYRNDKAVRELGFKPRPHEETLEETVRWQVEELGDRLSGHTVADAALSGAGAALRLPLRLLGFGRS